MDSKDKRMFYNNLDAGYGAMYGVLAPIVMSFVVSILYIIIGGVIGQDPQVLLSTVPWVYFANLLIEFGFVLVYMIYNKSAKINWMNATNIRQKSNVWVYVVCIVVGLVLPLCSSGIISLWTSGLEWIGYQLSELSVPINNVGDLVLAILVVALVPAICEELLFRGVVLNGLRSKGKWVAILLSALIFALMHNNIEQLPYTFALGVVLGYVVYQTGSIIPSVIMHACNNTIVLISMYMSQNGIWDWNLALTNIVALDIIIWLIIGILLVLGMMWLLPKLTNFKDNSMRQNNEYYSNKFIIQEGQQVPMQSFIAKQSKKMLGFAILIGVLMLILNVVTHLSS